MVALHFVWKACVVLSEFMRLRNDRSVSPAENSSTHITTTGSLVFQDFEEGMTGAYTCFLEYKPSVEEAVKNVQLKFIVYGTRAPPVRQRSCALRVSRGSMFVPRGLCSCALSVPEDLLAASASQILCEEVTGGRSALFGAVCADNLVSLKFLR